MDQTARQQIIDRLKEANNVLVTVSSNPSVDQLAACIGLTLLLNKLGKHGTAVFSGETPSTIEFLKPEQTIEKNTDSLRDFIIALDKSKADKLRYKVEDKVVKIFITPYRTSLSDKDLEFSQGDFNVDAVVALGVHERTELDQAITSHGRILHDATVISVNNKEQGELGAINWIDLNASSLSEMLVELARGLSTDPLDAQMATAFMTGIVAETARFSNPKTSPRTMALASGLMSAGANQQLIASKLEATQTTTPVVTKDDGDLKISHQPDPVEDIPNSNNDDLADILGATPSDQTDDTPLISHSAISDVSDRTPRVEPTDLADTSSNMVMQPPALGGQLTANSQPEDLLPEASTDPLSLPAVNPITPEPPLLSRNPEPSSQPPVESPTLIKLEEDVNSPHIEEEIAEEQVEDARDAVNQAIASEPSGQPLAPIDALGAQPINLDTPPATPSFNAPMPAPVPSPFQPTPAPSPFEPSQPPLEPLDSTQPLVPLAPAQPVTPTCDFAL